jgi:hypothetical protein
MLAALPFSVAVSLFSKKPDAAHLAACFPEIQAAPAVGRKSQISARQM